MSGIVSSDDPGHRYRRSAIAATVKIALLSFEYPPETGFGGIGTYTWHHARALVRLGHDVHVLTGSPAPTPLRTTEEDGVMVHRFWSDGRLMRAFDSLRRFELWWTSQRLQNALSMQRGLARLRRDHDFDIIEMPECGAEGALITRRVDVPTVVRLHSPSRLIMPYYDVTERDIALCSRIEMRALTSGAALSACSQFVAAEVSGEVAGDRGVRVITNGMDMEWIDALGDPGDVHRDFGLDRRDLLVVFVGRLERRKGVHLLPDIAGALLERFNVTLAVAGDDLFGYGSGTLAPSLAGRPLRGSIHLLGHLGLPEVRRLTWAADVVLLPSLWENCPYSYLEAMAAGRVVVGSHQGGIPELITDGHNGRLAVTGDATSFVDRLADVISDDEQRSRLGAAARGSIRLSHDAIDTARLSVDFYEDVIAGRTSRAS
ncbi:glycosyltransferase family 4 protein [soil metagenome]